ncbi:hypothetical protein SCG7086_BO_00110 [Chlamydiales bacterium SCGC AG-110-P3]|nr:hypothetical protein SCG7086_BO_00110 [Chlamydiales bacterium SCGC AG-110-P3]
MCLKATEQPPPAGVDTTWQISLLKSVLKVNPNNTKILMRLGDRYLAAEDHARSDDYYQRACSIDSDAIKPEHTQGWIKQADQLVGHNSIFALELYTRVWNIDHSYYQPYMATMIELLIDEGNIKEAVEIYLELENQREGCIDLTSQQWREVIVGADALDQDLRFRAFNKALETHREDMGVLDCLCAYYEDIPPESITEQAEGIFLDDLARAMRIGDDPVTAKGLYEKLLATNFSEEQVLVDDYYSCCIEVGEKDYAEGRLEQAIATYTDAYSRDNPFGEYMQHWIQANLTLGNLDEALRLYRMIETEQPDNLNEINLTHNEFLVLSKAVVDTVAEQRDFGLNGSPKFLNFIDPQTHENEIKESLNLAKRAFSCDKTTEAHYQRSLRFGQLNQEEALDKAIEIFFDPENTQKYNFDINHPGLNLLRAWRLIDSGNENTANKGLDIALAGAPDDPIVLFYLASTSQWMHADTERANTCRQRLEELGFDYNKFPEISPTDNRAAVPMIYHWQ